MIAQLQTDIQQNNSISVKNDRKIDVVELMDKLEKAVHNLIRLKLIIFEASAPMRETILALAEEKNRVAFLKGIDTHEGTGKRDEYRFGDDETEYGVAFDVLWVREQIAKSEEKIDKFQDELDTFNHKTEVEV